jgi:hypothetical protein
MEQHFRKSTWNVLLFTEKVGLINADAKIYKLEPSSTGSYESYLESQNDGQIS